MQRKYILPLLFMAALICLLTGCHSDPPPVSADTTVPVEDTAAPEVTAPLTDTEVNTAPEETKPEITLPFPVPTDELPVISVNTNGTAVNSKKYVNMTMTLTGTEERLLDVGGEIRLRGNSTYNFVKKPYRIRFYQKHSLMGLDKAKSWVLLADYLDPATLHNYAALSLAGTSENFDFVPTPYKVNLYLNGEYQGVYTLCEQVQEQEGRLGLEFKIQQSMNEISDYNFLLCMNYNAPEKAGAQEGVTYFYLPNVQRYFELEYPTREDFESEEQFRRFFSALKDYMYETAEAFLNANRSYLNKNVNVDSLIDLYIIDRIMGERDHHWKSVFMYYKGAEGDSTLSFGPPWDYDFCMYTQWTSQPNEEFNISNEFNPAEAAFFYRPLFENTYYVRKVEARYQAHFSDALSEVIDKVEDQAAAMEESLQLNQDTWYSDKPTITEDNVSFFIRYLKARKHKLDGIWK